MKKISGGITAPQGFKSNGIWCGIRKNKDKKDLALIVSEVKGTAAAVYTTNAVKGATLTITKNHIADGYAQAIICNSGNANTCNANGPEVAEKMCKLVEKHVGISSNDVIVASTGVIGKPLDITPIANGMESLVSGLGYDGEAAAHAIMTTDTVAKQVAVSFIAGGKECKIGCIAKGSGMIHPNMATMLAFATTDVAISPEMLKKAISTDTANSFNMVSIDGDTSTNDMFSIIANGMAGNEPIVAANSDYRAFCKALKTVTTAICKMIAKDGEGATKLLECNVIGAKNRKQARTVAMSVIQSSLLKAAMFGADANWGRVLCAIGYSGANVDISKIDVDFKSKKGTISVCKDGSGVDFCEDTAKKILLQDEIKINVNLNCGHVKATAWGCDLTYDYVRINGDYRT